MMPSSEARMVSASQQAADGGAPPTEQSTSRMDVLDVWEDDMPPGGWCAPRAGSPLRPAVPRPSADRIPGVDGMARLVDEGKEPDHDDQSLLMVISMAAKGNRPRESRKTGSQGRVEQLIAYGLIWGRSRRPPMSCVKAHARPDR